MPCYRSRSHEPCRRTRNTERMTLEMAFAPGRPSHTDRANTNVRDRNQHSELATWKRMQDRLEDLLRVAFERSSNEQELHEVDPALSPLVIRDERLRLA